MRKCAPCSPQFPARLLGGRGAREKEAGSCIAVVATDLPLGMHELTRIARRCGLGLARTGSVAHHRSCEIFLALSVARGDRRRVATPDLDQPFAATVEATGRAVLNALWAASEVKGREGRVAPALRRDDVLALLKLRGAWRGRGAFQPERTRRAE